MLSTKKTKIVTFVAATAVGAFVTVAMVSDIFGTRSQFELNETEACASGSATPEIFDMPFSSIRKLLAESEVIVLMHDRRQCWRVGMTSPFRGFSLKKGGQGTLPRNKKFGRLRIVGIMPKTSQQLSTRQLKYLSKILKKPTSKVRGTFYLIKIELVSS